VTLPAKGRDGLTLVELLVAMMLALVIVGSVAALVGPLRAMFQAGLETNDIEQRLRAASDSLFADLIMAGAGPDRGSRAGPLTRFIAPVLPFRLGTDPPGTLRDDALTIVYVPAGAATAALAEPMPARSASVMLATVPGCPVGDPACGFVAGLRVLVYDASGAFDLFTVRQVSGAVADLRHDMPDGSHEYPTGATIVGIVVHVYDLDAGDPDEGPRLMRDDGGSRLPLVDHVTRLHFDFEGDPRAPAVRRPVDPARPSVTYGPAPPPREAVSGAWPAGENCVFEIDPDTGTPRPRPGLAALGPAAGPLVSMTPTLLSDGPWCPDAAAAGRFDADLFRLRRLRVTIRVESALDALRGPAGLLFDRGGTGRTAGALVPDREMRFDVAPRNLSAGW